MGVKLKLICNNWFKHNNYFIQIGKYTDLTHLNYRIKSIQFNCWKTVVQLVIMWSMKRELLVTSKSEMNKKNLI